MCCQQHAHEVTPQRSAIMKAGIRYIHMLKARHVDVPLQTAEQLDGS